MKCPFCGFENDKVVDSRESKEADSIRRRRECLKCGKRFTTYERIDEIPYMVVKKDGRREKFDRQKVLNGLLRACEKRPVPISRLEQIVNEAEGFVIESAERERKTSEVGELIMNRLRRYDKVAYVRFASVYLDFKDVQEFMAELKDLLKTKEAPGSSQQGRGKELGVVWRGRSAGVAEGILPSAFRLSQQLRAKSTRGQDAGATRINMAYKVTLIPGDGIGPEVTQATVRILEATGVKFEWEIFQAGAEAFDKYHEYIPKELIESIERTRVGLKGPVTTPVGEGFPSINVALRKKFELYANFRPIRNLPHIPTRYPGVDLIIVRENTESLYSGIEHEVVPGVVESLKIITEKASTRIARFAFEYARKNQRKKIHAIHKANIMKLSDGLFLRCCRDVAKEYPEITYGEHIVDNTCMQLVMNPYQYDVLVMENLYGDIISDLCAAFVGGLGFVPSANLGDQLRHLRSGARIGA